MTTNEAAGVLEDFLENSKQWSPFNTEFHEAIRVTLQATKNAARLSEIIERSIKGLEKIQVMIPSVGENK